MRAAGWRLVNADCVLVGEEPRIAPHRDEMRRRLAGGGRRGRGQRPRDDDRPPRLHRPRRGSRRAGGRAARARLRSSRSGSTTAPSASSVTSPSRRATRPPRRRPAPRPARPRAAPPRGAAGTSPRTATASAPARTAALARASLGERADAAARHTREADGRAEVEERLRAGAVEARPVRSCTRRTFVSTGSTSRPNAKFADGGRGVRPDAGQLGQVVGPTVLGDHARGAVEVDGAPVVAESLPLDDHVRGRRGRERRRGRPALEPPEVARDDAVDLRLLEHHLADKDRVWILRPAPRKVASVPGIPGEKQLAHGRTLDARPRWR